jgi:hypothetical protein
VELDTFGWEALTAEAKRQGVSLEELLYHAAMHYLACDRRGFSYEVPRERPRVEPEPPEA